MSRILLLAALVAASSTFLIARADVLLVPPHDGQHNPLQDVLGQAAPGDVVLVQGNYTPQLIDVFAPTNFFDVLVVDRSLTIVGEGGSIGAVRIEGLAADETVVLRGLDILPVVGFGVQQNEPGVEIIDCEGLVILDDCTISGGIELNGPQVPGVRVVRSHRVLVSRSSVAGHAVLIGGSGTIFPPGAGIEVEEGRAAVLHSTVSGGSGETPPPVPGFQFPDAPGGAGLVVRTSFSETAQVFLYDTAITGGPGGDDCPPAQAADCVGGPGLVLVGPSVVRAVDGTWSGGPGGLLDGGGTAPDGADLQTIPLGPFDPPPSVATFEDLVPELSGPGVLRAGEAGALTVHGEPGDLARLFFALDLDFVPLAGKKGLYAVGTPSVGPLLLGTIPPSGELSLPLVAPDVSALGLEAVVTTWQAYTRVDDTPELIMSNPHELVVLAPGF